MTIPESQLDRWSKPGAQTSAKETYNSISTAIEQEFPRPDKDIDPYLQGSYRNSTNIYGDSDVDVVAQLNSTFLSNTSSLDRREKTLYERAYTSATYSFADYHRDVVGALNDYYGSYAVSVGDKAIKVAGGSSRLDADVLACLEYRYYLSFNSTSDESYVPGVVFWTQNQGLKIVNFPKTHYSNGTDKNAPKRTARNFKPTVRMFKNAREKLVRDGMIARSAAPSYFVECLVYNVPDGMFAGSFQDTYVEAVRYWLDEDLATFLAQNEMHALFGDTVMQWNQPDAIAYIAGLVDLWKSW